MTALDVALGLCREFEGFYSRPYLCPAGVPTIGYGTTYYQDGRRVTLADAPISKTDAEALLRAQLQTVYLPQVMRLCPQIDSEGRLGAILDFTYNLGASNLRVSTLRKRINAGDWEAVPTELAKWTRGGGKVLAGLVRRRAAESALI